ncbi:MAG TPA: malto-oligosyltrehalose trehalohydrolase [Candidatus Dormibacteraeota bacterium]
MHQFRVWAPQRRRVDAVVDGRRLEMRPAEGGWWEVDDAGAGAGSRYGFSLDGGEVRPDPRSPSQPDGVLGLSEVVDHDAYAWQDGAWRGSTLTGSILYELHVGTFSPEGTFAGAIARLPHLVRLGVDTVELMPVAEFSGDRGWGYDGADLYAPHHAYGGPDGLKRFVDACHASDLAVVLDVVYNHLGPVGNFLADFGPYFSETHHTPWGAAVNFDGPGSDEVRRFVVDNALMWLRDYHFDGLRLDAVHAIIDESEVHILEQLAFEVARLSAETHHRTFVVAESDANDPRLVRSPERGGYGLDASWADDWHHALHTVLTGEHIGYYEDFGSFAQLAKALRQAWVYDGEWSPRRRRVRGRKPFGVPAHAFVVAAQNHDQVGNRAAGERLCHIVEGGCAKAAAALLLTSPFTPLLFQGEEWAAGSPFQYFTDHRDPELGRRVAEGRRAEFASFGWSELVPDPQDPATFARSKLRWEELDEASHQDMLGWYRSLVALRRRLPPPVDELGADIDVAVDEALRRLSFGRRGVRVCVNLGDRDWELECEDGEELVMASDSSAAIRDRMLCLARSHVVVLERSLV